jgi:hypothetical protein
MVLLGNIFTAEEVRCSTFTAEDVRCRCNNAEDTPADEEKNRSGSMEGLLLVLLLLLKFIIIDLLRHHNSSHRQLNLPRSDGLLDIVVHEDTFLRFFSRD